MLLKSISSAMKPRSQLILGIANSMASALAILVMAPVYLRYLGAEAYGLIGFYTTLLICMQVFDMGMATTLNREVARHGAGVLSQDNAQLLRSVECAYLLISGLVLLGMWLISPWLVQNWLIAKNIRTIDIIYALYAIGISVALRLPINIYQSVLFGAQKMHLASTIGMVQIVIGALGALILLRFYSADIVVFFVWQALVALLHFVWIRTTVWYRAPQVRWRRIQWAPLLGLWRYAVSAGLVSIAGLVLSQIDKVTLSKTLDLEYYGYYMLATSLASCMYMLAGPFYNVFFPVVSKLIANHQSQELLAKYQFYSASLAACVFPLALYLILFFPQLIGLWTHSPQAVVHISPIASLLVVATSLHAVMHLPHALMMASGVSKTYLAMYLALILMSLPLTVLLSLHYGAIGGAWGQVILFISFTLAGTWITHRYCLKGYAIEWLTKDIGRPLSIVSLCAMMAYASGVNKIANFDWFSGVGSVIACLCLSCLCVLAAPSTRGFFLYSAKVTISKLARKYS
jgi:O-antigen/teichoic acid export membrane protein